MFLGKAGLISYYAKKKFDEQRKNKKHYLGFISFT